MTSRNEKLLDIQVQSLFEQLVLNIDKENLLKIREEKVKPESLERSGLQLFRVKAWTYVDLEGPIDDKRAKEYLQKLEPLKRDWKGHFTRLVAIVSGSTLSVQASQVLSEAGIRFFRVELLHNDRQ